ncbi:MAG: flagellar export protein FliJ [Chitinispirillia bacterium]|jgi:flagellar FliJ protein
MKRFEFNLQPLLDKRNREEEEIKMELARKNIQIQDLGQEIHKLKTELEKFQNDQKKTRENTSDLLSLKFSVSYRNKLKLDILDKGKDFQTFEKQQREIRQRLIHATQQKRAIELIKEKKYKEWLKEYQHREQVFIDDVSQQRFIRARKKAGINP